MAEFQFIINGEQVTYNDWNDCKDLEEFDNVIIFEPDIPEPAGEDGNHTEEQHEEMLVWNVRLQELMKKELR